MSKQEFKYCPLGTWIPQILAQFLLHCASRKINVSCIMYCIKTCFVTFDQPPYAKAVEIVAASSDLANAVVRLGGFHLLMCYLGAAGFLMGGSALESLWETVYASGSVIPMRTGHAYSRAVHASSSPYFSCIAGHATVESRTSES